VAILAIGVITGVGTGLIENAAKLGWLKVIEGLIAGKQFILYRNPSFIGSSPQCEIYLFRDNQVLRRHAALHMVPGGYEIEDLGTQRTLVNNRAVRRLRLHSGDRIQIGRTRFAFHEKAQTVE
jgi:pSer/pThr/pTyr-binding forkhead associated (FHA) protein